MPSSLPRSAILAISMNVSTSVDRCCGFGRVFQEALWRPVASRLIARWSGFGTHVFYNRPMSQRKLCDALRRPRPLNQTTATLAAVAQYPVLKGLGSESGTLT